jgi:very-short-patch-repair endonuclease
MFKYDSILTEIEKENIKKDYSENNFSIREIKKKYNIKSNTWIQNFLKGITRTPSEALKLAHKKYPSKFKHSEETKKKLCKIRLNFMKKNPESTAWRKKNEPSYPEKCFISFLKQYEYDKKYLIEREKSVYPFYVDFAFVQVKLAIEIDGSQHIKNEERHNRDLIKDKTLIDNGWKILRITENAIKTDWDSVKKTLDLMITDNTKNYEKVGIFLSKKKYKKVERDENGYSKKMIDGYLKQRKVKNRPTKEELLDLIKSHSMVKIGKMYGVSDNSVRKWCKKYDLPYTKKDIKNMI